MSFQIYFSHSHEPSTVLKNNMMKCFEELVKHEFAFKNDFAKSTSTPLPSSLAYFLNRDSFIAVEHDLGIIKAICHVTIIRFGFNYGHVSFFYVPETYRGEGHGTRLLERVSTIVSEQYECRYLQLTAMPNNKKAISFYEKQGFEPHVIGMSKNLTKGK